MKIIKKTDKMTVMDNLVFLEDIYPKDLLYAATIRSPVAKGVLKEINVPDLPDDYTLITAKDIPGENKLDGTNIPIFAGETLNYIGEPVAILLGKDKTKLEELALRCVVAVEEEKPLFNTNDSDSITENTLEINIGNTTELFQNIDKIVASSYTTGIQEHWYAEPVGAVTWWKELDSGSKEPRTKGKEITESKQQRGKKKKVKDPKQAAEHPADNPANQSGAHCFSCAEIPDTQTSGGSIMVIKTATQWPSYVKRSVEKALGLAPSNIIVEPTILNLHMDGKLWYPSLIACHAAVGTYITKKPVRLILTRDEDFLYSPKRCKTDIDIVTAINENGNINATEIEICVNLGAYGVNANEILDHVSLGSLGMYKFDNLKLTSKLKRTNIPPQGAFSGFGLAQGLYAIERHVSQIAGFLGQDPAQYRLNCMDTKSVLPVSVPLKNNVSGEELINTAVKISDYYRKWASNELLREISNRKINESENPRGIGIAAGFQSSGFLNSEDDNDNYGIEVTLTKEGILEINSNIVSPEDFIKIWEKIIPEILDIKPDMIRIITDAAFDSGPSCTSRNITAITNLVEKCCQAINKQRDTEPLPITVRRFIKPHSGSLRNGNWNVTDINGFSKPGLAAAVVEVSMDLIECIPVVRGIWLAVDGGRIISVNRAKRSLVRSINQALGWAFTENIDYTNGVIPKIQFDNYKIFSPLKYPPIHVEFLNSELTEAKGIGDLPFTCIPAAFMQAVSQAMDHSFKSIPLKRSDIWDIVRLRNKETHAPHTQANIKTESAKTNTAGSTGQELK